MTKQNMDRLQELEEENRDLKEMKCLKSFLVKKKDSTSAENAGW